MVLYIGNHTSSSKGYAAMGRQMLKNGGNTFAFLPEIPEEARQKRSIPQMWKDFWSFPGKIILESWWHMHRIP